MTFGSRFLGPVFKRKRRCFAPFSKRFASTLIVFFVVFGRLHDNANQEKRYMVASVRNFGYSRSSGLAHDRVFLTSPFSESIVFKSLQSGERFRMAPFSVIVFGVVVWTVAVSGVKQLCFRLKTD